MKKQGLLFFLIIFSIFSAIAFWFSIDKVISSSESENWVISVVWFSCLYVLFSLLSIIFSRSIWPNVTGTIVVLTSLLFFFDWLYVLLVFLGILLLFLSIWKIKADLEDNLRINATKTLRLGRSVLILVFALLVCGQYFFQSKERGISELVPEFNFSQIISSSWTKKTLSEIAPGFENMDDENLTVDEFIWKNYEKNRNEYLKNQSIEQSSGEMEIIYQTEELKRDEILASGREQLEEISGQTLSGKEKVADVFSEAVNFRINNFFLPSDDFELKGELISAVLTVILFLTLLSLGSLLSRMLVYLVHFLFWIFCKTRLIEIGKIPVEMEIIE